MFTFNDACFMKNNLRVVHLILLSVFLTLGVHGQTAGQSQPVSNRFVFEGIIGLQLGTITAIEASPLIGYKLTDDFVAGVGFTYQYSRYKDFYLNTETNKLAARKVNILGGRVFTRYYLSNWFSGALSGLFTHAEFEYLSYSRNFKVDINGKYVDRFGIPYAEGKQQVNVPGVLVGGGLLQPISRRAYVSLLILYNLNETKDTPYQNPVFRMGIGVGI